MGFGFSPILEAKPYRYISRNSNTASHSYPLNTNSDHERGICQPGSCSHDTPCSNMSSHFPLPKPWSPIDVTTLRDFIQQKRWKVAKPSPTDVRRSRRKRVRLSSGSKTWDQPGESLDNNKEAVTTCPSQTSKNENIPLIKKAKQHYPTDSLPTVTCDTETASLEASASLLPRLEDGLERETLNKDKKPTAHDSLWSHPEIRPGRTFDLLRRAPSTSANSTEINDKVQLDYPPHDKSLKEPILFFHICHHTPKTHVRRYRCFASQGDLQAYAEDFIHNVVQRLNINDVPYEVELLDQNRVGWQRKMYAIELPGPDRSMRGSASQPVDAGEPDLIVEVAHDFIIGLPKQPKSIISGEEDDDRWECWETWTEVAVAWES